MLKKEDEAVSFIQEYYKALTRNPKHLTRFYTEESTLTFLKENEEHSCITKNIIQEISDKHQRRVEKVLVCSLDSHFLNDLLIVYVIGQFVYANQSVRFSQQFVLRNRKVLIDNTRILDEEIIYTAKPNRFKSHVLKVKGEVSNKQGVFDVFSQYGRINYVKPSDNEFLIEFAKYEDAMRAVNDDNLRSKGIFIEVGDEKELIN
ncbi:nuclear transport factor 2 domain-containing [Tubulinosema ratisbonensis]|uniref:Nuclear transport factor 2 domain-containing n=1 Tax=Tubulinosema ratisbonensis TaxID=291195 RepID=A0A437AKE2_9MICR|nr:nuclear transport factor 2 domain-containing [Tubulinosema ratisbonensis]